MGATLNKKFGFLRTTLALWAGNLFPGRAGVVTDSTPGPVERWGWYDGSAWKFSARSGASETFSALSVTGAMSLSTASPTGIAQLVSSGANTAAGTIGWSWGRRDDGLSGSVVGGWVINDDTTARVWGDQSQMTVNQKLRVVQGLGVFGVTPPTSRPTVDAACTDLATCIALTNQLRTHLIACGLVQ